MLRPGLIFIGLYFCLGQTTLTAKLVSIEITIPCFQRQRGWFCSFIVGHVKPLCFFVSSSKTFLERDFENLLCSFLFFGFHVQLANTEIEVEALFGDEAFVQHGNGVLNRLCIYFLTPGCK